MASFGDFLGEYSKSRGVTDEEVNRHLEEMGPPMDKSYPTKGSGKPTSQPKMYYKARPKNGS